MRLQFKKNDIREFPLRLRNTLSGELEEFSPLLNSEVKMYNCGPTVYGTQHIGNMRAAVFADTLRRVLEMWNYRVKQVINITDFGHLSGDNEGDPDAGVDRMSQGLKREGMALTLENMRVLAEKYIAEYFEDIDALGLDRNKIVFPRASDYIPEQIALITALEEKGYAYKTKKGVYFDVARFPSYGKLGGIKLSGLQEGARVKENKEKRGPYDFILWKSDKKVGWDSPWGKGFPGWHIECTAMIFKLLGKQIDIHTGGIEHIPIHHNNEIAQAESATGKRFVKYWLHNDHITIEGKKISKSLGNTVYLRNLLERGFAARSLRYWFLTAHYRSPANFTWEALEGAHAARERLLRFFFEELSSEVESTDEPDPHFMSDVREALGDDLNTPRVIARVWDLLKNDRVPKGVKRASLLCVDQILGIGLADVRESMKLYVIPQSELPQEVTTLLEEREFARNMKDFEKADELRKKLQSIGFDVKDTSEGPKVTRI
jgi:cysteinyl-tRNA synthetase